MQQTDPAYLHLERRIGRAHLTQRLETERHYASRVIGHGLTYFHIENLRWFHWALRLFLKTVGLYWRGRRNAFSPIVRRNTLAIEGLPASFEGFTLLQLSDLHLDLSPGLTEAIAQAVSQVTSDLCVITGDVRAKTYGPSEAALHEFGRLRPFLHGDVYAVLGNHDFICTVPLLEACGVRVLLNEATFIQRDGKGFYLAGVDDAHYYETDNVQKASVHLDHEVPAILLSHTPEIYKRAAACGFSVMLCGHTHGGQICLPGGIPLLTNTRAPRSFARGAWRYRNLQGYTSTGTGSSGVDVRFWCPPEITLHTLTARR
jgi:predicted MPP superfamily phosphohydrolase